MAGEDLCGAAVTHFVSVVAATECFDYDAVTITITARAALGGQNDDTANIEFLIVRELNVRISLEGGCGVPDNICQSRVKR